MPHHDTVPITVLTGFLSAGKTTLLNHLLKQPELAGCAVLVNEFGEVGIGHLLAERLDDDVLLLNAGCLCCTVRGDLVEALRRLRDRMDAGQKVRRVVLETTGLADPSSLLHTLMSSPLIVGTFWLGGVVMVVDAVHGMATLDRQPEAVKQAAIADRLVISKTDLAASASLAALGERLRTLNPGAPQVRAKEGAVDPGALLDVGPFDPTTVFSSARPFGDTLSGLRRLPGGADAGRRLPKLLEQLRASPGLLARQPGEVSGGEAQRIALARLLAMRPAMLVADEPCSRLDMPVQAETMALLRGLADEHGLSVLLITHDADMARSVADVALRLRAVSG